MSLASLQRCELATSQACKLAHLYERAAFEQSIRMVLPVLYGNRESGHCYKVKLALRVLGIEHDYRQVDLQQPHEQRPPDFRQVSRFGEVPVFVEDGVALVQSNAILLHLARRTGRLGGRELERLTEWLFWEANRIGLSVPNLRAVCTYAADKTPEGVQQWLRARAMDIALIEEGRGISQRFLHQLEASYGFQYARARGGSDEDTGRALAAFKRGLGLR